MFFVHVRDYFRSNHKETFGDRTKLVTNVIFDSLILVAVIPFLLFAQWAIGHTHLHGIPEFFVEGIEIFLASGAYAAVGAKICGEVYGTFKQASKQAEPHHSDAVDHQPHADDAAAHEDAVSVPAAAVA
jgi:hypothetical protein